MQTSKPLGLIIKKSWRKWLRSIHRDIGYLAVGMTFIYALSGIAINHLEDWDPNFVAETRSHALGALPLSQAEAQAELEQRLSLPKRPLAAEFSVIQLELRYPNRRIVADLETGHVIDEYREDRFFFRIANWLHYNRGKAAWTFIADIYAILLLYLACSGLLMIRGKYGLKWRGTVLVALGIAVPVIYVVASGGPSGKTNQPQQTVETPASSGEGEMERREPAPATLR